MTGNVQHNPGRSTQAGLGRRGPGTLAIAACWLLADPVVHRARNHLRFGKKWKTLPADSSLLTRNGRQSILLWHFQGSPNAAQIRPGID